MYSRSKVCSHGGVGCTVAKWLVVSQQEGPGLNPCVELSCSPHACVGLLQAPQLPPAQKCSSWLIDYYKWMTLHWTTQEWKMYGWGHG